MIVSRGFDRFSLV